MQRIAILDLDVGNLQSLRAGLKRAGASVEIVRPEVVFDLYDAIFLAGVGNYDVASRMLTEHREGLEHYLEAGGGLFGVCLGLQLLAERSEEGGVGGLGLVRGEVVRLPNRVKVPHMGWNSVELVKGHKLFEGLNSEAHFYFAHSYYLKTGDETIIYGKTSYGVPFPSILIHGGIVGTQFHPEKSGRLGQKLLENFVRGLER